MKSDAQLLRAGFKAVGRTFRGTIWENASRFKLEGNKRAGLPVEQGGYFWIESANQIRGPLRALQDLLVRYVFVLGATQVLKSIIGELWLSYVCEHVMRNAIVYFEDDPKAKLFCDTRFMVTLRSHPILSNLIAAGEQHLATKTGIRFPGMTLKVCGLNDGNASSLSWPLIWISEAWQHKSDGLLWKAFKRADRFPDDCKVLCESQPGLKHEDLDVAASAAHQVPLTWACPHCAGRQTWEWKDWSHKRPANFIPREMKKLTTAMIGGQTVLIVEQPRAGTYAGMRFPDDGDGSRSVSLRAAAAYWECIHCGGKIEDVRSARQALMDSYEQDYRLPDAPSGVGSTVPSKVCFTLPFESARDNKFAATVERFIVGKHNERMGNRTDLMNWFMAERALAFSEDLLAPELVQSIELTSSDGDIPNLHHRGMIVDCQKDLILNTVGTFHYCVYAADRDGNSFELARGFAGNWEEWIGIQKQFKVPNNCVHIDGRKWTDVIFEMAAKHREVSWGYRWGKRELHWSCWRILFGENPIREAYKWPDGKWRLFQKEKEHLINVTDENGAKYCVSVFSWCWHHRGIADMLEAILAGGPGKPKFTALPREALSAKDRLMEVGTMAYDAQMKAERAVGEGGRRRWEKIHSSRPNHRLDIARMRVAAQLMRGLLGYVAQRGM